ncbi:hypothetical protein EI94DRAFT_1708155 [Lactarius quietus]|nr:hypothetical protein EI94DRAFT_1708155 [Lactarius quietus]
MPSKVREKKKSDRIRRQGHAQDATNNVSFWFLQYYNGRELTVDEVRPIHAEAKNCWKILCKKYGPLGLPWQSVLHLCHLESYITLEAQAFATEDYTHWYKLQFKTSSEVKAHQSQKKRTALACHASAVDTTKDKEEEEDKEDYEYKDNKRMEVNEIEDEEECEDENENEDNNKDKDRDDAGDDVEENND